MLSLWLTIPYGASCLSAATFRANPPVLPVVEKVRLQVAGELTEVDMRRRRVSAFRGYEQVLLQNLFQDLQGKLGAR